MIQTPTIGRFGIWQDRTTLEPAIYALVEKLGYGALWVGNDPRQDLRLIEEILDATDRLVVATSVIPAHSITTSVLAAAYHRVQARHSNRLLVGIGAGRLGLEVLAKIIDDLQTAGVPREHLVIGSLGQKSVQLAGSRTAGAHPFLVNVEHSRLARGWLGPGPFLAPEQRVVVGDSVRDFSAAAAGVRPYTSFGPFRRILTQLGYGDEFDGGGSDRLHHDLIISGSDDVIRDRLHQHLGAGADHVAIDVVKRPGVSLADDYAHLAVVLNGPS